MAKACVYEKKINIPTYCVGKKEKNPMFFEKRVYQGSSGKVYPYPVIEKIYDEKADKEYNAIILENDWLYVIVLPELGGRIYTAYDKTNGYDFIYHNRVIKPALVGLLGPWISGGIEFNWPQHHRPTTYMPVNYSLKENSDGSVSVFVGETEAMFGLKQTSEIKLYADKSFIEIKTDVYNRGELPQTFLWWANPAFRVNDDTATIMPKDVTAVMDHGKRAVSTFPIATGEYYKMNYCAGVDISRYKNIPVPTSFMAYKSDFDFVGGYDYGRQAGLLHVANHHISPGKKQWTWGCGDFGKAWDRNLTDEDGPYVELMTGCFTDNQPDFTFIRPHETKSFTQYFMPYKEVGEVLNANENICFSEKDGVLTLYSAVNADCEVIIKKENGNDIILNLTLSATESKKIENVEGYSEIIVNCLGRRLDYSQEKVKKFDIPSPAKECPLPKDVNSNEELYLCGKHIEQYRHATRLAEDYYLEALNRDESDVRVNNAYGLLLLRKGRIEESIKYLEKAIEGETSKNPNPRDTECFFNAGVAYFMTNRLDKAYDAFYKCLWGNNKAEARYYLAVIDKINNDLNSAIEHLQEGLIIAGKDTRLLNTLGRLYQDKDDNLHAEECFIKASQIDILDCVSRFELGDFESLRHIGAEEIRILCADYIAERRYGKLSSFIRKWKYISGKTNSLIELYLAYAEKKTGNDIKDIINEAERVSETDISFAVTLTDLEVLSALNEDTGSYFIPYSLGNLHYDKRNYDIAAQCWEKAIELNNKFPTGYRNLALYYFNKKGNTDKALSCMEEAFNLDKSDSRILLELFELYGLCDKTQAEKYSLLSQNFDVVEDRDDLYLHYLTLLTDKGEIDKAYALLNSRRFHPWEGGEGKTTKLYKRLNVLIAKRAEEVKDFDLAKNMYLKCFAFPENLGEGKLILDYDNDICYRLGELEEARGNAQEAMKYYRMATRGDLSVADDMYYNDNPIEYVYYAALAFKKLGELNKANNIKKAFINYYDKNFNVRKPIDYFAVSLPNMLIWEHDLFKKNNDFCTEIRKLADKI